MDSQGHIDVAYCILVDATQRMRTAVANLRVDDPASMKTLEAAKAAWEDALARFREAAGPISMWILVLQRHFAFGLSNDLRFLSSGCNVLLLKKRVVTTSSTVFTEVSL